MAVPFDFRDTQDAGRITVATRDIQRGEDIMTETPLIYTRKENAERSFYTPYRVFKNKPRNVKTAFLQLYNSPHLWNAIAESLVPAETPRDIRNADPILIARVASTLWRNCFEYKRDVVVYQKASRINHACCPNVVAVQTNSATRQQTMRAMRKIDRNEELMCTYIQCHDPVTDRRAKLLNSYDFMCRCALCEMEEFLETDEGAQCWVEFERRFFRIDELREVVAFFRSYFQVLMNAGRADGPAFQREAAKWGITPEETLPYAQLALRILMHIRFSKNPGSDEYTLATKNVEYWLRLRDDFSERADPADPPPAWRAEVQNIIDEQQ